nr:hypothetical protein CFP56_21145 [Quercus suber]
MPSLETPTFFETSDGGAESSFDSGRLPSRLLPERTVGRRLPIALETAASDRNPSRSPALDTPALHAQLHHLASADRHGLCRMLTSIAPHPSTPPAVRAYRPDTPLDLVWPCLGRSTPQNRSRPSSALDSARYKSSPS